MATDLTTLEAAALLTERGFTDRWGRPVRPDTVKHWCAQGRFPGARQAPGRRGLWLIPQADLDAFVPPRQSWRA